MVINQPFSTTKIGEPASFARLKVLQNISIPDIEIEQSAQLTVDDLNGFEYVAKVTKRKGSKKMPRLIINLEKFKVVDKNEWSSDEAYMWCFGVVIDANTISSGNYIIPKKCGHGNIGKSFEKGQSRNIPKSVGYIELSVKPIFNFIGAGVIVLGWEEDNTPNSKVEEAYHDSVDILNNFIEGRVASLNFDKISETEIQALRSQLTKAIEKRFKSAVHWYNPFSWDPDDYLGMGQVFEIIKGNQAHNRPISFNFKGDDAHYSVTGNLSYSP